jgi:hypothetical protein
VNLHGMVSGAIAIVNPFVPVSYQASTGSTTLEDGTRVPAYAAPVTVSAQVQALTYQDLLKLGGLNIQGVRSKLYVSGSMNGIVRGAHKGGDLVTMADGSVWLVAIVLEDWPDWTSLAITLQVS